MSRERADLGFAEALETFNPEEWKPQKPSHERALYKDAALQAATVSGFSSREPQTTKKSLPQRRHRTGRNAQLNLKARPETISNFSAIADRQGWTLAETLEKAVFLLEREYEAAEPSQDTNQK